MSQEPEQSPEARQPEPEARRPRRTEVRSTCTAELRSNDRGDATLHFALPSGYIYRELRRVLVLAVTLFILYRLALPLAGVLLFFLIVFILSAVLNPPAAWLEARGVPRMLSAVALVLTVVAVIGLVGWLVIPPLLDEMAAFVDRWDVADLRITAYYQELVARLPWLAGQLPPPEELVAGLTPGIGVFLGQLGRYVLNLATAVIGLILLIVLVTYSVARPEPLIAGLLAATPDSYRRQVEAALTRSMTELKNWVYGTVIVGTIIGTIAGVGLYLLGVPHALLFGVLSAMGELLPWLGPYIAAFPPVIFALTIDPWLALWVVVFFFIVQQLESNVITPLVLGERLQMHPVSLIFVMLVMHSLFGILGALLAMPVAAIIKVCWEEFYLKPRGVDCEAVGRSAQRIVSETSRGRRRRAQAGPEAADEERAAEGERPSGRARRRVPH